VFVSFHDLATHVALTTSHSRLSRISAVHAYYQRLHTREETAISQTSQEISVAGGTIQTISPQIVLKLMSRQTEIGICSILL